MSHRYIELFLNSTSGSSGGMSLSGIGNFCGGIISFFIKYFYYVIMIEIIL